MHQGFTNAIKAFIELFKTPQRSVKIKLKLMFILKQLSEMRGAGWVNLNSF